MRRRTRNILGPGSDVTAGLRVLCRLVLLYTESLDSDDADRPSRYTQSTCNDSSMLQKDHIFYFF